MAEVQTNRLLEDAKLCLRITSDVYDTEIEMLIDAAQADMERVGVKPTLIQSDAPLVKQAVMCWVKWHFGYDNSEATRFGSSYRSIVASLLNSQANIATEDEDDTEEDTEEESEDTNAV